MRLAIFHNLGPGGAKRHLFEQLKALRARGHTFDLFVPAAACSPGEFLPLSPLCDDTRLYGKEASDRSGQHSAGPDAVAKPSRSAVLRQRAPSFVRAAGDQLWLNRTRRELTALSRVYEQIAHDIDAGGYDAAYVHHCRLMLAPELLRYLRATPTVFCCHDTPRTLCEWPALTEPNYDAAPASQRRLGRVMTNAQAQFADHEMQRFSDNARAPDIVLANSFYSRECLARVAGVDSRVCPPGVDSGFFTPSAITTRENSVVSVGALLSSKRHDLVLRAVALIPTARRPKVEVLGYEPAIARGTEGERLCALASTLGVRLTIGREVTDRTIRDAYRKAGVVAVTPYLEPFGLVALEAAACGAAVVGVREGGVRETVRDGETGLLSDAEPSALAEALSRVLEDSAFAVRLGAQARTIAETQWSWERSASAAEAFLLQASERKRQ